MRRSELVAKTAKPVEVGPDGGRIVEVRGYSHEPTKLECGKVRQMLEQFAKLGGFRLEPCFGLLGAELDLDQHRQAAAEPSRGFVEAFGERQGVEGIDRREKLGGTGCLVRLQKMCIRDRTSWATFTPSLRDCTVLPVRYLASLRMVFSVQVLSKLTAPKS